MATQIGQAELARQNFWDTPKRLGAVGVAVVIAALAIMAALVPDGAQTARSSSAAPQPAPSFHSRAYGETQQPVHGALSGADGAVVDAQPADSHGLLP